MSEPCKACGGSGVIWYMVPGREARPMGELRSKLPKKRPSGPFPVFEESDADRAMRGIPNPEQFMADVRLLVGILDRGDGPHCQEHYDAVARLAAALKGEP